MSNFLNRFFKGDSIIWTIFVLLACASVVGVFSSTGPLAFREQGGNTSYYVLKQTGFLLVGAIIVWGIHNIKYTIYSHLSIVLLPISIGCLLMTLIGGDSINQASRWLTIPFIGVQFQPSELAKLALIMFVARKLSHNQTPEKPPEKAFVSIILWTSIVCALVISEDLSSALLIGGIVIFMMFIGRMPIKYLLLTGAALIAIVALLAFIAPRFDDVSFFHRVETWTTRINTFSDTENATKDASLQSNQSKIAIASGGLFGNFFGDSRQSNYLPHSYSDFIYSTLVEKGGFVTGIFMILLYFILLYRVMSIAQRCNKSFPIFLITGLGIATTFQAFAHMWVCTGLAPVTGQTLPLVSLGGTSILLTSVSFGMILGVAQFAATPKEKKRRTKDKVEKVETAQEEIEA